MNELKQDCLFCKIIRGEVPSYTIFENEDVKAFLDLSQVNPGHTLMIPKKHLVNFFDYSSLDIQKYLQYIPEIANAIKKFDPKISGMNISTNNGSSAGQVVMHSHIHFIPRFEGDGLKIATRNNEEQYSEADYQKIATQIKAQF
ncbi:MULTISPECIES: HIT family protein [unclassified Lactobacillus]|uniref:HIT family protein n=1 Tax=unclassified Lactobacillus TaxID=2620435 RepID=UPI000EFD118B|nr:MULTISPECIES: HIT family protein [unclassified Lactobacillus]RMC24223.1 HIT family protein [Lactobacillus sp. ESL0247]RMC28796.1 HIT family protein [Lactobacillus sp. ESL0246]RMC31453.1 HIT family protein [Lactobacillus sp. ESL0245]RMC49119.1 HIT family protein [Lactobacillus sp. ESL0228]